jgi:lysophospholipase
MYNTRVLYKILEFEVLLDSTNMLPKDWIYIATKIEENYEDYDSFILLHGTDTMGFTGSALSFMLENLAKTVVITGS